MAALVTQTLSNVGADLSYTLSAATDTADIGNGHDTFVVFDNGTASTVTWTINVPGSNFLGVANAENVVPVPANSRKYVPLRKEYFDESQNGRAVITVTPGANVRVAVVRVG